MKGKRTFNDFDAIDYESALLRVNGDEALFKKLLGQFINREIDFQQRIKSMIDKNDKDGLHIAAHTLKGSAANMGMIRLSTMAFGIEECLEDEEYDEIPSLLDEIDDYISPLFSEILQMIEEKSPSKEGKLNLDIEERVHTLDGLLQNFDTSAIEFLEKHYQDFEAVLGGEEFERCCKSIQGCDFDEGSSILRNLVISYYPNTKKK